MLRYVLWWAPGLVLAICVAAIIGMSSARGNVDAGWTAMLLLEPTDGSPLPCRDGKCWTVLGGWDSKKDCDLVLSDAQARAEKLKYRVSTRPCVDTISRPVE